MVSEMQYIPWQNVADWHCKACGYCCKLYSVVLGFPEWLRLPKRLAPKPLWRGWIVRHKRCSDGSCAFRCKNSHNYFCGLQNMKPKHAKSGRLKCLLNPNTGPNKPNSTTWATNSTFMPTPCVAACGMESQYGSSVFSTVKEFVELALGIRGMQYKWTRRFRRCKIRGVGNCGFLNGAAVRDFNVIVYVFAYQLM